MKDRSKEKYFLEDLCLGCKHTFKDHFVTSKSKQIWCGEDGTVWSCPCHNFILDNLRHIEILAKEKGLV